VLPLLLPAGDLTLLAVGAHPDDIEIGCGGTLLRLAAARDLVAHVAVLTGTPERQAEAQAAARRFLAGAELHLHLSDLPDGRLPAHWGSVKQWLEELARTVRPDLVLAPRREDAHQDHRLLAEVVPTVWRDSLVLHYEIPKWDGDLRPVTHYVPLDDAVARRKVDLLDECYPSQRGRDWWDEEMFLGLMRLRGMECRGRYAEGFAVGKARLSVVDDEPRTVT
jgi:LmbE family N-acetylglucosaminyl deacetylase